MFYQFWHLYHPVSFFVTFMSFVQVYHVSSWFNSFLGVIFLAVDFEVDVDQNASTRGRERVLPRPCQLVPESHASIMTAHLNVMISPLHQPEKSVESAEMMVDSVACAPCQTIMLYK